VRASGTERPSGRSGAVPCSTRDQYVSLRHSRKFRLLASGQRCRPRPACWLCVRLCLFSSIWVLVVGSIPGNDGPQLSRTRHARNSVKQLGGGMFPCTAVLLGRFTLHPHLLMLVRHPVQRSSRGKHATLLRSLRFRHARLSESWLSVPSAGRTARGDKAFSAQT
jgi:hypothetical protein